MLPWGRKSMYGPLVEPHTHTPRTPHPHQTNPYIDFLPLFQSGALHGHGLAQDLPHQLKLVCPLTQTRRSELVAPWLTNSLIRALVAWVPSPLTPSHPYPCFLLLHSRLIFIVKALDPKHHKFQIVTIEVEWLGWSESSVGRSRVEVVGCIVFHRGTV